MNSLRHAFPEVTQNEIRERYRQQGLRYLNPEDVAELSTEALQRVTDGVVEVMNQVFKRGDPAGTDRYLTTLRAGIADGTKHLFVVLNDDEKVLATTQHITRKQTYAPNSPVKTLELSSVGRHPVAMRGTAKDLILGCLAWAHTAFGPEAPPKSQADYLFSQNRVAQMRSDGVAHHGNILRTFLAHTPAIPAFAEFAHNTGPSAEPFVQSVVPLHLEKWARQINEQTVYAPDSLSALALSQILKDFTPQHPAEPRIEVATAGSRPEAEMPPLYQTSHISRNDAAEYVVTQALVPDYLPWLQAIPRDRAASLSSRVTVEHDVVSDHELASATFEALGKEGFSYIGWRESALATGRLAIVMGRPGQAPSGHTIAAPNLPQELRQSSKTAFNFLEATLEAQRPEPFASEQKV